MSTRSERIRLLIEQSGLSYQELEKTTGIKKSSLQRYASGATAKIPLDAIEKLSKYFNVSQEYLMGWSDDKKTTAPDSAQTEGEKMWMELYHKLSANTREVLIASLHSFDELPPDQQQLALDLIRVALRNKK
jgi:transcriptional regulator with XRE-family HTH domain